MALDRDVGLCQDCLRLFEQGLIRKPRPATIVHHLEHVTDRPDLALDINNLISLCDECHNRRHPEKGEALKNHREKQQETNRRFAVTKL